MQKIIPHLNPMISQKTQFLIVSILYTIIFIIFLYVDQNQSKNIFTVSFFYAAAMWLTGFRLSYLNKVHKTKRNIFFYYNLVTYITVNTVELIYILLFRIKHTDEVIGICIQILIWGIFLGIHYKISKNY